MKRLRSAGILALRVILGSVLVLAGVIKVSDPAAFAEALATFQILPARLISITALSLPFLEIIIGVLLLTGWRRRCATFSAMILFGIYTGALVAGMARNLPLECDCFGSSTSISLALVRDVLLVAGAIILYLQELLCPRPESRLKAPTRSMLRV